mgnify:CR=1 FL=1|tara:strand:- start:22937 stop:23179 length:243 start_codon:yes stop_codon:yes gene_type:complete
MASITIRNLDDRDKARLRIQAAKNGRSMEEEVRTILKSALIQDNQPVTNLAETIQQRFASIGGIELPEIPREPIREPLNL